MCPIARAVRCVLGLEAMDVWWMVECSVRCGR